MSSFIPTRPRQPSAAMPSQQLASFRNQNLGSLTRADGQVPHAAGHGPMAQATPLKPRSEMASAAQSVSLSPVAQSVGRVNTKVAEGNARLNALTRAAAVKNQTAVDVGTGASTIQRNTGGQRAPQRGQISVKDTVQIGNAYLRKDAAHAFIQMDAAFKQATGRSLGITEGWRSYDRQVELYNLYRSGRGNLAAYPGTSTHGSGTAVDINGYGDPNGAAFQWLRQNAPRFGYSWTGGTFSQIEPWHWDYVW